ncbi:MAG: hypothetical protein EP330_28170 [Deltaproteobacteria bacterium]|nr:MAG: hypothetical protein EP330_28170 [Deltaproteobacteria bacterium]
MGVGLTLTALLAAGLACVGESPSLPDPSPPAAGAAAAQPEVAEALPALRELDGHACGPHAGNLTALLAGPGIEQITRKAGAAGDLATLLASSSLAPSGIVPAAKGQDTGGLAARGRQEQWACQYSPGRLFDDDPATAWCEGMEGDGLGESVVVPVDASGRVEIWAGYGKSDALHAANAAPRKLRVTLLQAAHKNMADGGEASAEFFERVAVLGAHEVTLEDRNGWQDLPLPKVERTLDPQLTLVGLTVLESRGGAKYEDLCISGVRAAN